MDNAHMLYLQILSEAGVIGLGAFLALAGYLLRQLWNRDSAPRPVFWTFLTLLGTGLTQETLYPVPAFEHTLALAMCSVALCLSEPAKGMAGRAHPKLDSRGTPGRPPTLRNPQSPGNPGHGACRPISSSRFPCRHTPSSY